MNYQVPCVDMVIISSKLIGTSFEKKFHAKSIIAPRYTAFLIYFYLILRSKLLKNIKFHVYHEGNNTAEVFQTNVFFPHNRDELERYLCS